MMTARQREHSKLFKQYGTQGNLINLARDGDIEVKRGVPLAGGIPDSPPFNLRSFLQKNLCDADAVVLVSVQSKSSQLTTDEDYVFTDYQLVVGETLKDNLAYTIGNSGQQITLTRSGGFVRVDGHNIKVVDSVFKPLEIDKQYLLFLKFIPETLTYESLSSRTGFLLERGHFVKLTDEGLPKELENVSNAESFLATIRSVINDGCKSK
ncbi:MAG TPA: hypothetical protein VK747_09350 [Blastocatellia bacterium]|nr:hypothetical protein [Blastocatellia bacterium]